MTLRLVAPTSGPASGADARRSKRAMREQGPDPWWSGSERYYWHQQYLSDAKNPNGYRGLGGTGVSCPVL
jgi:hypothetical protein